MGICRVFEHLDGSLSVVHPAPESRGVVEHAFDRTLRIAASATVEEHNAAIAFQVAQIIGAHPEVQGAAYRLDVAAEIVLGDDGRLVLGDDEGPILDVTVHVVFGVPEAEDVWLDRVFARSVEVQPHLDGRPFRDVDPADLPSRSAPCADGCGEEHSTRDQWRMQGSGENRAPSVDATLRNRHAEISHVHQAIRAEVTKGKPDGSRLAALHAVRDALASATPDGGGLPSGELVAELVAPTLASARASLAGRQTIKERLAARTSIKDGRL